MRIVSLEKDPEIVNDDEAIQVMRINENGDAVEVALDAVGNGHLDGVGQAVVVLSSTVMVSDPAARWR